MPAPVSAPQRGQGHPQAGAQEPRRQGCRRPGGGRRQGGCRRRGWCCGCQAGLRQEARRQASPGLDGPGPLPSAFCQQAAAAEALAHHDPGTCNGAPTAAGRCHCRAKRKAAATAAGDDAAADSAAAAEAGAAAAEAKPKAKRSKAPPAAPSALLELLFCAGAAARSAGAARPPAGALRATPASRRAGPRAPARLQLPQLVALALLSCACAPTSPAPQS
jgi:hypothetical protein